MKTGAAAEATTPVLLKTDHDHVKRTYGKIPLTRLTPSIEKTATLAYHLLLDPPGGPRHFSQDRSAQEGNGAFETLASAQNRVFVFNRERTIVTSQSKLAHHRPPEFLTMPVSHGAEDPGPLFHWI